MVFNSFSFLFLFFPVFLIAYYRLPARFREAALCVASLVFYGVGVHASLWQLGLLAAMCAVYVTGCALFRVRALRKKALLALWVAVIAAPLAYVKLAGLMREEAPSLPLGLSFYTFQMIAILVFAFRSGNVGVVDAATGALLFPKLLSGPLAQPERLLPQLARPKRSRALIDYGVQEFVIGFACKVVVADHLAGVLGQIRTWGVEAVSVPMAWLGMIGYALQLYFDFMGYSRMAVGVAAVLGIELPENFRHPYCAKTVGEFWRRWHITLGQWFKEYVYIPLGGSRNGMFRMVLSTLAVWLLTGVWHGAGWNYVCWGMMMFVLIMLERLVYGKALSKGALLGHVYVPLLISLSWVFFITPAISEAGAYYLRLAGFGAAPGDPRDWIKALEWCWPYLAAGVVMSTPLPAKIWKKISGTAFGWLLLFILFWVCVYFMATATSDPFLYFSF